MFLLQAYLLLYMTSFIEFGMYGMHEFKLLIVHLRQWRLYRLEHFYTQYFQC
jgi:hypothetical protein